jgi:hypothetical protein
MLSGGATVFTRHPSDQLFPPCVTPEDRETWEDAEVEVKISFRTSVHRTTCIQVGRKKCVYSSLCFHLFLSFVLSFFGLLFICHMFLFFCLIISCYFIALPIISLLFVSSPPPLRTLLDLQTVSHNSARFIFPTLRLIQPAYRRCRRGCLTVTANCRSATFRSVPSSAAVARSEALVFYMLTGFLSFVVYLTTLSVARTFSAVP